MYKILIADKLAQEGIDVLNGIDGIEAEVKTGMSEDELVDCIGEYDGIIIRSATKVTKRVMEAGVKLKGIARAGVGVDNIEIPEATKRGIIVMNTPGGNTLSAAEHTMALMLSLSRNVVPACNSLKTGAWDRKKYTGNQLNGKVLGIIGMGRIGMAVAKMSLGFGMKVLGYDPFAVPKEAEDMGIAVVQEIEDIYKLSDYISLHIPRTEQTVDMISEEEFKMMKPTARIINCARGGIINEDALYDALEAGTIAGGALDVYPKEPPENTRFSEIENCLVTPHLGASTEEAQIEVAVEAAHILADAISGGPVRNALNAPGGGEIASPMVEAYSELAKRIGTIMSIIAVGPVKKVEVQYRGAIAEGSIKPVTTGFTIGLLERHFDVPVNIVNVDMMAKERGISVDETKNADSQDLLSTFTAKVTTGKCVREIRATVFGGNLMRITDIDGFELEITPEGTVMIIYNDDKPGVIGVVGTACGKHGINIDTMGVGHKAAEGKAILGVSLDKVPDEEAIKEIGGLEFVNEIYVCKLD